MTNITFLFSTQQAGGIKNIAKQCRQRGLKTCLLTDIENDSNKIYTDDMLIVNWHYDYMSKIDAYLANTGITTVYAINLLEELLTQQKVVIDKLEIKAAINIESLEMIANKVMLRKLENITTICYGNLRTLYKYKPESYPIIIKPNKVTGGSKYVYTCANLKAQHHIIDSLLGDAYASQLSYIAEPYYSGIEYSLDCIILQNRIIPLMYAEKIDFNYNKNQDGSHILAPSRSLNKRIKHELIQKLTHIVKNVNLSNAILHVEFRVDNNACYIIEVNPRFGGRMYASAIRYFTGIDMLSVFVDFQLGKLPDRINLHALNPMKKLLFVTFHGSPGTMIQQSNHIDVAKQPFIYDHFYIDGFKSVNYQRENIFAEFLVLGNSLNELLHYESILRQQFTYHEKPMS